LNRPEHEFFESKAAARSRG